jgi:hypothetical protein
MSLSLWPLGLAPARDCRLLDVKTFFFSPAFQGAGKHLFPIVTLKMQPGVGLGFYFHIQFIKLYSSHWTVN